MNQVYSVIVNRHLGIAQVVSEVAGRKKFSAAKRLAKLVQVGVVGATLGAGAPVWAEEVNETVNYTEGTYKPDETLDVGKNGAVNIKAEVTYGEVNLGLNTGMTGKMDVSGMDSIFTSTSDMVVGFKGPAELTVNVGGKVWAKTNMRIGHLSGSAGVVSIKDHDSSFDVTDSLKVGNGGSGHLTVSSGATATAADIYIGPSKDGKGIVSVEGSGSSLKAGKRLFVSNESGSQGHLTVSGGATATAYKILIGRWGDDGKGTVSVEGSGSSLKASENLTVGGEGSGHLTVSGGGLVSTRALVVDNPGSNITLGAHGVLETGKWSGAASKLAFDGGTLRATADNLMVDSAVTIDAGGAFIDTRDFDMHITKTLSNKGTAAGGLTKKGLGKLTLSGDTYYTGDTVVDRGVLIMNGHGSASNTFVNNGGALSGTGQIDNNVTIYRGGKLIGMDSGLKIGGNLDFNQGSTLQMTAGPVAPGAITVDGKVTISPEATVTIDATDINYSGALSYQLLRSTKDGVTGEFGALTDNFAFLKATLVHTNEDVTLNLARNDANFADVAQDPKQYAVAKTLDHVGTTATGDMGSVITTFTGLSAAQAQLALTTLSGASYTQIQTIGTGFANTFGNQMQARLQVLGAYGPDFKFAANDTGKQRFTLAGGIPATSSQQPGFWPTTSSQQPGFWVRGNGNYQRLDDAHSPNKTTLKTGGMSAGVDARVNRHLVVGAAVSYGETDLRAGINDEGKSKNTAVGVYASYATGPWGVNGNFMLGRSTNSMERSIQVGGINRKAESSFNSNTLSGYGEVTYDIYFDQWTLQPIAGVSVLHARTNAFTEHGANALNLDVSSQSRTTGRTMLGTRATFDLGHVLLQPRAIWAHDLGKTNQSLTMQMQGVPTSFTVTGTEQKRDALITGLTLSGELRKNTTLFVDMQGEFKSGSRSYGATVGLRVNW